MDDDETEVPLVGGDVSVGIVRVGATVRRPHQPASAAVAAYLRHLEQRGFDGAPRHLGTDERGRDVLTWVEGRTATSPPERWATSEVLLASVGRLLRGLHDASADFVPPPNAVWHRDALRLDPPVPEPPPDLVSHLDMTPQNVVVRGDEAVALIDFDLAGPTTRRADLLMAALHWVPFAPAEDVPPDWAGLDAPRRLRVLVDGYGLEPRLRTDLVDVAVARVALSYRRMEASAEQLGGGWARMWEAGMGERLERRRRWLLEHRTELQRALVHRA